MKRLGVRLGVMTIVITFLLQVPVSAKLTKSGGVNYYEGHKETWYNLSMDRVLERADRNFGKHHKRWIRDDGAKMYGPYIIAAGAVDRYGEIIGTSLGEAIILDTGAFALDNPTQIDVAVNW